MKKLLFLCAVILSACTGRQPQIEEGAKEYELLTVETKNHTVDAEYAAQIRGAQDIRIIPRVDGYLQAVNVKEGDQVKKGQLLFVIDQVAYRAAVKTASAGVQQAVAQVAKAQQDLEGKTMLRERQVVSDFDLNQTRRDLDVAKANLEAARAQLEAARNNLSFTELRSPSDGVIGRLPYRKGDYVGPSIQDGLTVVSDNKQMFVYFSMTESRVMDYLAEYSSMQEAISHMPELSLALAGGKMYDKKGFVESVSGIVDDQTGSVSVRAIFPNAESRLLSGGTARVVMPQVHKDAIVIPQEATYEIQDKVYVYKVINGKASSTIIDVERLHDGTHFIVNKGLKKGDVIIAKGAGLVREGAEVKTKK